MSRTSDNPDRFGPNGVGVVAFADAVAALTTEQWKAALEADRTADKPVQRSGIEALAKAPLTARSATEKLADQIAISVEVRSAIKDLGRSAGRTRMMIPVAMKAIGFRELLDQD